MASVVTADLPNAINESINAQADILKFMVQMDDVCLVLFTLASLPVVFIVNSLLNKAI